MGQAMAGKKSAMKAPTTNLEVLKKSKQAPGRGDVFAFKPRAHNYYFGLVVNPLIRLVGLDGSIMEDPAWAGALVYVYDQCAPTKDKFPMLDLARLLVPP